MEQAPAQDSVLSVEPVRRGREFSERINALIADLRKGRAVYSQCFVVRQGELATSARCLLAVTADCCNTTSMQSLIRNLPNLHLHSYSLYRQINCMMSTSKQYSFFSCYCLVFLCLQLDSHMLSIFIRLFANRKAACSSGLSQNQVASQSPYQGRAGTNFGEHSSVCQSMRKLWKHV